MLKFNIYINFTFLYLVYKVIKSKMSCVCMQCWRYWGPAECGPCGRDAGRSRAHRDTSAWSV